MTGLMWNLQESASSCKRCRQAKTGFVLGTVTSMLPVLYVPWETAEKKEHPAALYKSHTLFYPPQHNCQPLFVSNYLVSKDKEHSRLFSVLQHYGFNAVDLRGEFGFFGSTWLFLSVQRGYERCRCAQRGKQSICQQGRLLDTLQERDARPTRQAKWGMINDNNLDPEPSKNSVPDVDITTHCMTVGL